MTPPRSLRPCPHPGCMELVRGPGRCEKHQPKPFSTVNKDRPSFSQRGYGRRWAAARAQWLRDRPLCGQRFSGRSTEHSACAREGRAVLARQLDHIVPHAGPDSPSFWDPNNWQSLCARCHAAKSAREGNAAKRGAP